MRFVLISQLFVFCSIILSGCGPGESISTSTHTYSYGDEEDLNAGIERLHSVEALLLAKGFRSVYESLEGNKREVMLTGEYDGIPNIEITFWESRTEDKVNADLGYHVHATYKGDQEFTNLQAFRSFVSGELRH